ncbi:MAG TPA: DNA internalization-related competence protein ComEC/Rec2 [Gemmatimonadaceae bacterium]|nr:DNA internalization-related competence protein ComEC/Rec2 [Gemmatimonadaceae bacterium]
MPTTSWILLCIIIGSAAGAAGDAGVATMALAACALVGAALRRAGRLAVVAPMVLAAAAAARATADRWHVQHCRAVMVRASGVEFVTDFDLHPGDAGPARLRVRGDRCTADAVVRARTHITGGAWHQTPAQVDLGERGLTVLVREARETGPHSLRPTLRAAGVRRVDSIFTIDAAMARALLLADMHLIAPEMRRRWARSGLVHLLSVSGVHVAIIATALLLLGRSLRLSERHATAAALTVTAAYILILGLPPPAVRAGVMFGSVLLARLRQRPASEWSVLLLGALLPVVVDPAAPLDLGWQLSVLGVVSLAASGKLVRRLKWRGGGWKQALRREFVASIIASAASAPIIAWYFGTVSLIAPVANLVAAPLISVLQPALFLALACAPLIDVARFVAGAAHPVLVLLDRLAETAAAPSWSAVELAPTLHEALLGGLVVAAVMTAMIARSTAPPLFAAGISAALLFWHDLLPSRGSGVLEVHMLDVGQGDAIAVRTPRGRWIVVDAGGGAPGIDRGRRTVLPYIRRLGGDVAVFILSHPHLDHVGGAPALIGATSPERYVDGAFAGGTDAYRASLESAAVHKVRWARVHPGDTLLIDDVTLRFLAPDSTWTARLDDANLASTIVRVEYGNAGILFVGDAELAEEEWLLENVPLRWLRADVLKVGHHGSRTSTGEAFLDAVAPSLALVSVGRGNRYGHPSPEVVQRLARRQITVVRTDVVGTAVVRTDGRILSVSTAADRWSQPSPASALGSETGSSRR